MNFKILITLSTVLVLSSSCFSQNRVSNNEQHFKCNVLKTNNINYPKGSEVLTNRFNKNNLGIQVLKVTNDSGYDFKKSIELYQVKDNKIYMVESDQSKITQISYSNIIKGVKEISESSVIVACENRSSRHISIEYYLKKDEKIISSLILSGSNLKNWKSNNEISQEIIFFSNFDSIIDTTEL